MDIQRWDRAKEKVGNTFELTVLIQKRVRELIRDRQRPLVDFEHRNPIQVALEEILQDKIYLAPPTHADESNSPPKQPHEIAAAAAAAAAAESAEQQPSVSPLAADPTAAPAVLDSEDLDVDEGPVMSALD
ncbi:MAG: DNA-directed RNA polymerase subunit omega [Planctomycetota bacterium]|nr:DNA-directed RNA polymerase subunit omega [Planctomycetota bacterium]